MLSMRPGSAAMCLQNPQFFMSNQAAGILHASFDGYAWEAIDLTGGDADER